MSRVVAIVRPRRKRALPKDPLESAKAANLRHVDDAAPGIARKKSGKGFTYVRADGATVKDAATLKRIRGLVIPPAWTNVWICASADGHIQATGRDARGRKQYRYHPNTVLAAAALRKIELEAEASATALKKNVVAAIKDVAARLGNTAAVCRRCYVHPEILGAYLENELALEPSPPTLRGVPIDKPELSAWESAVLGLLRARLSRRSRELRAA